MPNYNYFDLTLWLCAISQADFEKKKKKKRHITQVSPILAAPRPQAGNRGGGLANEGFGGPAGLAMMVKSQSLFS